MSAPNRTTRKKRLACDNCHVSKVRCTGETTGCQRCQRGNRLCHYSESNMGKCLHKAQKRRILAETCSSTTSTHLDVDEFDWISSSAISPTISHNDSLNTIAQLDDDTLAIDPKTLWAGPGSLQKRDTFLEVESPPDEDFPPLVCHPIRRPLFQRQRQMRHLPNDVPPTRSHPSTPDINYWAIRLDKLSRTPDVALDQWLYNCSTLLPQVSRALQSLPADVSCLAHGMLILLCLTQTIAQFEKCLPSLLGNAPVCESMDIALHLGVFQVDHDVQKEFQKHIVTKELSQILDLSRLVKTTLQNPGLAGVPKRTHNLLNEDLRARAKMLLCLVHEKWNFPQQVVF